MATSAFAACGSDPPVVPVRNLERPSDMSFVCLGVHTDAEAKQVTGRPMFTCHPSTGNDPEVNIDDESKRALGTFGLVTNTARGEIAVVDLDRGRLMDLDPALPGYNMLPVGSLPETLAVSQDGCRVVTANRGSCDLTLIDPGRLLVGAFPDSVPTTKDGPAAQSIIPTTTSGRSLRVAPAEVIFLPQALDDLKRTERVCKPEGFLAGGSEAPVPWRALVTFPSCDLVALVEIPSGRIVSSVYVRPDGIVDAGGEPVCADTCGAGGTRSAVSPDGAATSDGAATGTDGGQAGAPAGEPVLVPPLGVASLALLPDGRRVYVGASRAPFVTVLDITAGGLRAPAGGGRILLADEPGGVTRLRLSIDPFALSANGQNLGRFVGARGEFLYAFVRDGSARVIQVDSPFEPRKERECDTNVDPLALGEQDGRKKGCYPISDDPSMRVRRRPLAQGPGLRIPVPGPDLPPAIPRDIAFASLLVPGAADSSDQLADGAFGFMLASNGNVYLVNIDPTPRAQEPDPMPHSLRNRNLGAAADGRGSPRVVGVPSRNFSATSVSFPTRIAVTSSQGPRLEGFVTPNAATGTNYAFFPDETAVTPQRWSLVWEGLLPGSDRSTGQVQPPTAGAPAGVLVDEGADHCRSNVQRGDVLLFAGCGNSADCGPDGAFVCQQISPAAPGMCVPNQGTLVDDFVQRCGRHLGSRQRYEIVRVTRTRLELALKVDEVPKTSLDECDPKQNDDNTGNPQCQPSAAFKSLMDGDPGFTCHQLRVGEPNRCVKRCKASDRVCRPGFVCENVAGVDPGIGPLCVEGPPIPAADAAKDSRCWFEATRYAVQAGKSFLVGGTSMPRLSVVRETDGECQVDPARHPLVVNRIPLDAPHCANIPDGEKSSVAITKTPTAGPNLWGNPCLFKSVNEDDVGSGDRTKALFQNPQMKLILTNLDQWAGDVTIIAMDVVGGFLPTAVEFPDDIILTIGVRIVTGPTKTPQSVGSIFGGTGYSYFPYLYVVDQGHALTQLGGRGQILRINPRGGSQGRPRFDTSSFTNFPFHIQ